MTLSLNKNEENTLLFAITGQGTFTAQVSITKMAQASPLAFNGTTLPMTELVMPSGHSRVFMAKFTPTESGEYIFSYYAINSQGEISRAIQRGAISSGGSSGSTFGVGL
tara:strand:+ start:355 stop:681 length:327 start_codon:yes stop_codon:yes gene_type:complete